MSKEEILKNFDQWLENGSEFAAIVMRQWLEPIQGTDSVIFPPTYATPERSKEENWIGYNIDGEGATSVCQIDSVGSQANRMEPIFKRDPYRKLVPQIIIKATTEGKERKINLLDAGHRAADAIVRFSQLGPELHEAFQLYRDEGNVEPLARIAPTSIIFGSWDSRATQAKLPRIVRSVIRAYDVKVLHRSAQYETIAGEMLEGVDVEVTTKGPKAELGLAHVPAAWTHGGIQVFGEVRRDAILKLATIRALTAKDEKSAAKLQRYLLGLALVSFTATPETFLREGCELVTSPTRAVEWKLVRNDGTREDGMIEHDLALSFATASAEDFGVRNRQSVIFDSRLALNVMNLKEKDRKKLFKQGPVTNEKIEILKKKSKTKSGAPKAKKETKN